ncbi:Agmatine deiminase [Enhygromyxa salina]|uniref:Agmatine deiminase n=1 Tax=Enhygromyxa salina TaxID=215803 RepID=A0A2S9XLM9_9BACT|nr:agmatine deiminase family protein [Enhygromyxa salina]PRP93794.1 Agmatine deiminase [Enhygromyxa salina]
MTYDGGPEAALSKRRASAGVSSMLCLRLLLATSLGSGFEPGLAAPADSIPGQVPAPVVIHSAPVDGRVLRADFEVPRQVLLVFTQTWPRASAAIAAQVLDSGTRLALVRERDSARLALTRFVTKLERAHGQPITTHADAVDTPWVRDWGPLQLRRAGGGSLWLDAALDDALRAHDDGAPGWLARHHAVALDALPWAVDGGAFISNGAGLCVLSLDYLDARGVTSDTEALPELLGQLGCRVTAVVPTLVAEHTKHVDMIAQFVGPDRLMVARIVDEPGGASEDALRLEAAERGIRAAAALLDEGVTLDVVHVPTPPSEPGRNPRSYVNGLRLADRYLMPSYPELGPPWQREAQAAVQEAVGELPVVAIDASDMIGAGGAIHCATLGLWTD